MGQQVWALVLAGSENQEDERLTDVADIARGAGYSTTPQWGCDDGAPSALGLGEEAATVSLYFGSKEDAQTAAGAFKSLGIERAAVTEVKVFCVD